MFFSVLWHPSGESTSMLSLADNHILMWDVDASGKSAKVLIIIIIIIIDFIGYTC